uniref:Calpain catalytic domain-containing protein n=1 Tax=Timema bartmani TaxID=61472 RepID=A0A7R9F8Q1_9NEOP|nr:unnamed protein product [Timema bartmani]
MDLLATTGRTSIKKKSESLDSTKTSGNNLSLNYFVPPWPEWVDAEINAERWDANVGVPARSKEKSKSSSFSNISFEDPYGHGFLPEGIVVYDWKRITTFTLKADLIVKPIEHDNNLTYPDLISSNHHILHNSLMRWIVCSIMNLYHLAEKDPFPVEGEGPNFFPTGGRVWKPWHHVYSICKVGKGQGHKPAINPFGKYIVRLYFMGTWRRITVDDYIPVDQNNRILLPTCDKTYEIWPLILTKALLKIASLVWEHGNYETDFNVVTCLTGWMDHVIDCKNIPIKYSWLMIQKLLMADNDDPEKRYKGLVDNKDLKLGNICNPKYVSDEEESQTEIIGKVAIFGVIHDLTRQIENLEGISPCLSHPVLISEARDITYGYDPERPKTPRWKQYRWKAWADYKGTFRLKDSQDWVTLLRFVVNIHGNTDTLCSVHFFSSIPVCIFRVIDNDTMKDIPKQLGDIRPQKYQQNRHGYTIIAHMATDISKYREVNWKLRVVGEKNENLIHSCSWDESGICKPQPPQTLLIQEKRDGMGMIVIPVCKFNPDIETEQEDTFKYTYVVEVEVLNNSWTLTDQEKSLISNIKENKIKEPLLSKEDTEKVKVPPLNKTKGFSVGRKSVINYIQDKTPELIPGIPFWCVQVVIDSDKFTTVSLDLDQRHEEGFRSLKSTWEKEEPGRQKRSMEIRNDFVKHLEEDDSYRLFINPKIDVSKKSNLECIMMSYHKLDDDINNVIILNDEIQTKLMKKHVDEELKAQEIREKFRERLHIESKAQEKRHMLMLRHQDICREESKNLMIEAYTLLDNIINNIKELQDKNEFSKNNVKTSLKDKPGDGVIRRNMSSPSQELQHIF